MYNTKEETKKAKLAHDEHCMNLVRASIPEVEEKIIKTSQKGDSCIFLDYSDLRVPSYDVERYASNTKRFYKDTMAVIKNELIDKYNGLKFKLVKIHKTYFGRPYTVLEIKISW